MTSRETSAGFTLVETLIALSIFALIALGGVALLDITVKTQDRLGEVASETRALQRMQVILRSDFGQMVERVSRNEQGAFRNSAAGGASLLTFARLGRLEDPDMPRPRLETVRYWLEDGIVYRAAYPHADGARRPPAIALISDIVAADVKVYRGQRWAALAGEDALAPLPEAVQVTLMHRVFGQIELRYMTPAPRESVVF